LSFIHINFLQGWLSLLVCSFGILLTAFLHKHFPSSFGSIDIDIGSLADSSSNRDQADAGIAVISFRATKPADSPMQLKQDPVELELGQIRKSVSAADESDTETSSKEKTLTPQLL
jgi:hypothetical protein